MNLIIDVGNTRVKFAVFQKEQLIVKQISQILDFKVNLQKLKTKFPKLKAAIISSVGQLKNSEIELIEKDLKLLVLSSGTKIPFKNKYATPKTLGVDRIALVSAAVKQFPEKNALIIDAGTCITYDFITSENSYLGGAISPGIRLRYKSLHNLTANLPLLKTDMPQTLIGNSTEGSIHSGVIFGVVNEINGIVNTYTKKYTDLTVILTGGDTKMLSKQLKSSIFANSDFLLEGLNYILEFNLK